MTGAAAHSHGSGRRCAALAACLAAGLALCGAPRAEQNVILLIGDGMGAAHRQAATWLAHGPGGSLEMDRLPVSGRVQTAAADDAVTDSAAAATAMATGVKTRNGVVGLDARLKARENLLEFARARGRAVGLVTTTQVAHATPAAFAAHVADRDRMPRIAAQMSEFGPELLLGGGEDEFLPAGERGCYPEPGEREDGRSLIAELQGRGWRHVCDARALARIDPRETRRLIGLFADEGMPRPYRPTLADMTAKAIALLSQNEDGFFLMVEGGQIDWASHDNDARAAIADTLGLDEAVGVARAFAESAPETLVIVTADHETGGMSVTEEPRGFLFPGERLETPEGRPFYVSWSTTGHTAEPVPLTAAGPSAGRLRGTHDNTYLHRVMREAMR